MFTQVVLVVGELVVEFLEVGGRGRGRGRGRVRVLCFRVISAFERWWALNVTVVMSGYYLIII